MHDLPELQNHWYVVCRSADLGRSPRQVSLLGRKLAIFRMDGEGSRPAALVDRCPHRNAPLSAGKVRGGCIECPYHGWRFDGAGECRSVPGLVGEPRHRARKAAAYPIEERDGFIWLAATPAVAQKRSPPEFELLGKPGYRHFTGHGEIACAMTDAIENFLDGTHTHFVHPGLIRTEGARKRVRASVVRARDHVEITYRDEGAQSGLIWKLFGGGVDLTVARFRLPSLAELEYRAGDVVKMRISLHFTPFDAEHTGVFAMVVYQAPRAAVPIAEPVMRRLFRMALDQDIAILEKQAANIRAFGGPQFVYTELDVVAPHMLRLLKHGPGAADDAADVREVTMMM